MTRVLSALVGIPLTVAAIYLSAPVLFRAIAVILVIVALLEYLRLWKIEGPTAVVTVTGGAAMVVLSRTEASAVAGGLALLAVLAASLPGADDLEERFHAVATAVLGMMYIGYAFVTLTLLRQLPQGASWVMTLLVILWAGDTGAYYGGRRFGSRKLAPVLSPNKTWEGAVAGLAGSAAAAVIFTSLLLDGVSPVQAMVLGLAVGASGQVGDLVQSFWKRARGVKDSGSLIPGHGGLLDRIDSLLLGAPVGYSLVRFWIL